MIHTAGTWQRSCIRIQNCRKYLSKKKECYTDSGLRMEERFKCILVPQVLQDFMIILAHNYSSHNSSRRTYNSLKRQYYWAGHKGNRFSDIARNVRSVCYKIKDSQRSILVILIRQICQWSSSAWTWWDPFTHPAAGETNMC